MRNYLKVVSYTKRRIGEPAEDSGKKVDVRSDGQELALIFFNSEDALETEAAYKQALEVTQRHQSTQLSSWLPMPGYISDRDRIGTLLYNCGHWVWAGACPEHGRLR